MSTEANPITDAEIVEDEQQPQAQAIALRDSSAQLAESVKVTRPPDVVLKEAKKAADALQNVIASKPKKVMMNGEQYLEFEDWQTVGKFYGISAREDGDPEFVQLGDARGFKASSVAVHAESGAILSRATAYCLTDEEKWRARPKYEWHMVLQSGNVVPEEESDKSQWVWEANPNKPGGQRPKRQKVLIGEEPVPLFQLSSMAQTRANAKALRNVLAWVVVLAGYRPTPAEELESMAEERSSSSAQQQQQQGKAQSQAQTQATPAFDGTIPFGKHKGVSIDEVPTDYLEWCLENMGKKLDDNMRAAFSLEIDRRSNAS